MVLLKICGVLDYIKCSKFKFFISVSKNGNEWIGGTLWKKNTPGLVIESEGSVQMEGFVSFVFTIHLKVSGKKIK